MTWILKSWRPPPVVSFSMQNGEAKHPVECRWTMSWLRWGVDLSLESNFAAGREWYSDAYYGIRLTKHFGWGRQDFESDRSHLLKCGPIKFTWKN